MSDRYLELPGGCKVAVDEKGYLTDPQEWTENVAEFMAQADGVHLTADHWAVLRIFRDYFSRFDIDPPMRALVKLSRDQLGEEKGKSRYLYRLFPNGPGTQACRYAGLPRPLSCI